MPNPNLRVMVTGSQGFIGKHLCARLTEGAYDFMKWERDIRALSECNQQVDVVFHLAAVTRYEQFAGSPQESYEINVAGTLAVLNYCQKMGARCVLTSTSAVYRAPADGSRLAEDSPLEPRSPYAISKCLAESVCRQQEKDLQVPSIVLRIFNVYGTGQHPSFLVPYVVTCLLEGQPIVLRMPHAIRDFVAVEDVVEALLLASKFPCDGFRVFNIASGKATKVLDLVRTTERIFGPAQKIETRSGHQAEPDVVVADVNRAREELGWQAKISLESGLLAIKKNLCRPVL
ncbi:NAD(P)-dependent oxidoreductase [Acidobacteria bacterium AH-259-D05]|nr:NAD(P)-dependent oxidoreductase [Acidobacteria bacterium AH-259-D05]